MNMAAWATSQNQSQKNPGGAEKSVNKPKSMYLRNESQDDETA